MKVTELELTMFKNNEAFSEIFAGFCILSDVQELCSANSRAVEELNHAKSHFLAGMNLLGFFDKKEESHV